MASDKRLDQVKLVNRAESVLVVNGDQVEKAALAGFANSMGSSVPLQQTSEQVNITGLYARTSDGKMVELTKESVASVVAGLIPELSFAGTIMDGKLDDYTTKGRWFVPSNSSINGKPTFASTNGWYLIVNEFDGTIFQEYVSTDGILKAFRIRYGTTWKNWSRIDNFGYNTLAELSSGVAEQNRLYIGEGCSVRAELKNDFDTSLFPAVSGCRVRFDNNNPTGIGHELFFVRGGGLWFWNEQGGGWKEIATK